MAGIYIHIPFCKKACNYCNFHFSTSLAAKEPLLEAIKEELRLQKGYLKNEPVDTIYIGGGTPSLLSAQEIQSIFSCIEKHYPIDNLLECTLEANPDDLDSPYLEALRKTPVNRLSIGVQTFKEADLLFMNRAHSLQQVDYALKCAQDKGFSNISIDLIYGTPHLSMHEWENHLQQLIAYQIPHFSSYALTVEPKTALAHQIKTNQLPALNPDDAAQQFLFLMDWVKENNFDHYEISNFGKANAHAIHNTNYWKGIPYLGIGPSAHSYSNNTRQWNMANNQGYIKAILQEQTIPSTIEELSIADQVNEYIMTSLRTMWGCDLDKIKDSWHISLDKRTIEKYIQQQLINQQDQTLFLTQQGKLFADAIAADLFIAL
jgi:oxygen-independent coproporphyrinogen-3 oxidase